MNRIALVLSLVLMAALAAWFTLGTSVSNPGPAAVPAEPAQAASDSYWPLVEGCLWRYEVSGLPGTKRFGYYVRQVRDGEATVLENRNGSQSDNFRGVAGAGGSVTFREDSKTSLFLPPGLKQGSRWQVERTLKAVCVGEEAIRVPALGGEVEAMRVEYERLYEAPLTKAPGWYPDGARWFVKGVGMVREDFEDAQRPPDDPGGGAGPKRFLTLIEFQAPWWKPPPGAPKGSS